LFNVVSFGTGGDGHANRWAGSSVMNDETFRQIVESAFAFLRAEHAFSAPHTILHGPTEHDHSRYVRVIYSHDSRRSVMVGAATWRCEFDVEISIGAFPESELSASLDELLAVVAPTYVHPLSISLGTAPSDRDLMMQQVSACAKALRHHGTRFFAGDRNLWTELEAHQAQRRLDTIARIDAENSRRANDRLRSEAQAAFRRADWAQAVSLYESVTEPLTAVEQKRLSVARKRLN
jgi:hypothetical protein